jgi:hypothetical protein
VRDSVAITVRTLVDSAIAGRLNLGLLGGEQSVAVSGTGGSDVRVPFALPVWARHLVVDLELDPEQWPHFTDFGLTALDSAGRILEKEPANYAHSRLSVGLPPHLADEAPSPRSGFRRPEAVSTGLGGDDSAVLITGRHRSP